MSRLPHIPPLRRKDLAEDPFTQFGEWYRKAEEDIHLPNAMSLATTDRLGRADVRMVLLKGFDKEGFRFFTNYESNKAHQIEAVPYGALAFYWNALDRQVRARGFIRKSSDSESDAYFKNRDRASQLGAWASPQSEVIESREALEGLLEAQNEAFEDKEVKRPKGWGGYILRPERVEFWQGGEARLHDRFCYTQVKGVWQIERLAP